MPTSKLQRLIYTSSASSEITSEDVQSILDVAQRKNVKVGITGALIFTDGTFIQILEGTEFLIDHLMGEIRNDHRHNNLEIIHRDEIDTRMFPTWSMAYIGEESIFKSTIGLKPAEAIVDRLKKQNEFISSFISDCVQTLKPRDIKY